LFRLGFGYGQVFAPTDFLNPRDPLHPDTRTRGILGAAVSWYPDFGGALFAQNSNIRIFAATPKDALVTTFDGYRAGVSAEIHGGRASVQGLFVSENGGSGSDGAGATYRFGGSVKVDALLGWVVDVLYTSASGLVASGGADYTFADGKAYVVAEYCYSDTGAAAHQVYAAARWSFTDYTALTGAALVDMGASAVTPVVIVTHDLFQGAAVTVTAQFPNDDVTAAAVTAKLRIRL
jgi:hypothetical protein